MSVPTPSQTRRRSRGLTMLETLLAIGLGAMIMVGGVYALNERTNDIRDKATAEHLRIVSKAVDTYVRDNFLTGDELRKNAPQRILVSTTGPLASYLPPNFGPNPYGQTYVVVTRPIIKATPTDPAKRVGVEAMIVTGWSSSVPKADRRVPDPKRIPAVAALVGATGGYFAHPDVAPLTCNRGGAAHDVCGAYDGFAADMAGFAPHTLEDPTWASLLYLDNGTLTADYLYRYKIGEETESNTMHTSILMAPPDGTNVANLEMGGNDINNAGKGTFTKDVTVTGKVDTGTLVVQNGVQICVQDQLNCGVAISTEGGFYDLKDGWITFRGNTPNAGLRLSGTGANLSAGGTVAAASDVTSGRDVTAARNVTASSTVNGSLVNGTAVTAGGASSRGSGTVNALTDVYANRYLVALGSAWPNTGCSQNGSIAISQQNGGLLFCQWGIWKVQGGSGAGRVYWDGGWTSNSFWCDPGYVLQFYHYESGSTNNAVWAVCNPT